MRREGVILAEEKTFTDSEIVAIKDMIYECMESYNAKEESTTNEEWLKDIFLKKINGITEKQALEDAERIVKTINSISNNLSKIQQIEVQGISKEKWLQSCIVEEVGEDITNVEELKQFDDAIYSHNMNMAGQQLEEYSENNQEIGEYSTYQLKELALDIGKNASAYGIQSATSTVGTMLVDKIMGVENITPNQIIQEALKSGVDTSMQVISSGALKIVSDNQLLQCLPPSTPAGIIASICSGGVETTKILSRIASGEITITKGIEQFGRLGVSMIQNLWVIAKETSFKEVVTRYLPFLGPKFAVASEIVGTIVAFMGGTDFGKLIVTTKNKVASAAKVVAKTAVQGLKKAKQVLQSGIKKAKKVITELFN